MAVRRYFILTACMRELRTGILSEVLYITSPKIRLRSYRLVTLYSQVQPHFIFHFEGLPHILIRTMIIFVILSSENYDFTFFQHPPHATMLCQSASRVTSQSTRTVMLVPRKILKEFHHHIAV